MNSKQGRKLRLEKRALIAAMVAGKPQATQIMQNFSSYTVIEIQPSSRIPGKFGKPTTNCHIIVNDKGQIIEIIP